QARPPAVHRRRELDAMAADQATSSTAPSPEENRREGDLRGYRRRINVGSEWTVHFPAAALTIATIPARTASGSRSQAASPPGPPVGPRYRGLNPGQETVITEAHGSGTTTMSNQPIPGNEC